MIWSLPSALRQWYGKSSAEICAQIKDPMRNGGLAIDQIATHIHEDMLVSWGWQPGRADPKASDPRRRAWDPKDRSGEREKAPYSKEEVVKFLGDWEKAGAPCPTK
jgi:hypothetical protein